MKTGPRIVTFCPEGRDLKDDTDNRARFRLMAAVAGALAARTDWHPIDAVLFPGGFVSVWPEKQARAFAEKLADQSPGLQLVTGMDKDNEQFALSFNAAGLSGSARKIFPVAEDIDAGMTIHERDFSDPARFITLSCGTKALLCVCYDMFGLADTLRGKPEKLYKATLTKDAAGKIYKDRDGRPVLTRAFNAYTAMLGHKKPALALATIHRFAAPGREIFWQRHGLAAASAALRGGLAIGAAHSGTLPSDPRQMALAARAVPQTHLEAGKKRAAHMMEPEKTLVLTAGRQKGLLRLYRPGL